MLSVGNVICLENPDDLFVITGHGVDTLRLLPLKSTGADGDESITSGTEVYYCNPIQSRWVPFGEATLVSKLERAAVDALLRSMVRSEVRNYHAVITESDGTYSNSAPVSGKVIGSREIEMITESALDGWLTTGRFNDLFEKGFAEFLRVKHVLTCNSGSSANLLAVAALTSPKLKERRLQPGDEVLTVAAGFPTTVNPLFQYGLVPVFVDVDIPTYNVDAHKLESAITEKTRAIMLAHTLGNAFDVDEVLRIARKYNLWVIEDCCDALGTRYASELEGEERCLGTFGDIATFSFYPAHHITMGEGGAVATQSTHLKKILESFRDWGRDCWCPPGKDNTCKCRFDWQLGSLPEGYDHKYIYSHTGFNLKITDMQAAAGVAQLERLEEFIAKRRENFEYMTEGLAPLADIFILPEATPKSTPSWFGYPITIRENVAVSRGELLHLFSEHNIGVRLLFGGNLLRQPYFENLTYRIAEQSIVDGNALPKTDMIMKKTFWIGIYHGLSFGQIDYVTKTLRTALLP